MKRWMLLIGALMALMCATPARANTGIIVRTTNLQALQTLCLLPATCTLSPLGPLDGTLNQVFLITTPLPVANILSLLQGVTGFVDAEVDQALNLVGLANLVPSSLSSTLLSDRTLVAYPANSTTMVWNSYATQPAASIVEVQQAQSAFNVTGTGIVVADIDTGVDPNHPALQGVLLPGYDFTRNQAGGSELNDLKPSDFPTYPPPSCSSTTCPSAVQVNQSSAAVLDQSSAAVLDNTSNPYAAFGHGTMVMGIIHLVAPTAQLLPLKAFHSDGTANLSDILRAIYYAGQNGANVINMSFDTTTPSAELQKALDYVNQLGVISAASAGNDGTQETVYPAALQTDVMGVASVGSTPATEDTRSSFSNFGTGIVWVAAPGEEIITTYPFSSYAAGWGTSFSAPFVSGGAALLRNLQATLNEAQAAAAVAHAAPLSDATLGNGRLDLVPALQSLTSGPDFGVSATPASTTITAGQTASYTVSAAPVNGSTQTVIWSCTGAPAAAVCSVSPSSVTLDGTHAATATVTLTTTARAISPPLLWPRAAPPSSYRWLMLAACFIWTVVLLVLYHLSRSRRWRQGLAAAAALFAVALFAYSCGGGYGGPPGSGSTTLYSIELAPTSVNGGTSSTGTVTLSGAAPSGGAVVTLSSSASAATVPANVTVAAGATSATFTVTTSAVTAATPVTIAATYGGTTKTTLLTVNPATAVALSSVAVSPATVNGGSPSTGTVTLSGAAPSGGAVVTLSSSASAATVPANVTVTAGATSATFTVTTSAVTVATPVTISASYGGTTKTTLLTVNPVTTGGTPAGTYTLTVTGTSGTTSHSTTVTVVVN
ncbi:MAG TPA: S8 family serine peptidase [Candidatus Binatus sp.]|nr:S8 family serine peptidase [Candidatus Binatus sp.]